MRVMAYSFFDLIIYQTYELRGRKLCCTVAFFNSSFLILHSSFTLPVNIRHYVIQCSPDSYQVGNLRSAADGVYGTYQW